MSLNEQQQRAMESMMGDVGTFLDRVHVWVEAEREKTHHVPIWTVDGLTLAHAQRRLEALRRLLETAEWL